jgi:hypothetical protein
MKGKPEIISLSAFSGGYNPQQLPHANSQEPLIYGDCRPHLLPSQPGGGISKICEVSCPSNCRSCAHLGNKSHQIAYADVGVPCFYDKWCVNISFACSRNFHHTIIKTIVFLCCFSIIQSLCAGQDPQNFWVYK